MAFVLARWDKSVGLGYFSTHPPMKKRIDALIQIDKRIRKQKGTPTGIDKGYFDYNEPFIQEIQALWHGDIKDFKHFVCYGAVSADEIPSDRTK